MGRTWTSLSGSAASMTWAPLISAPSPRTLTTRTPIPGGPGNNPGERARYRNPEGALSTSHLRVHGRVSRVAARLAPTVDTVANSQASQTYDSLIQDVQNLITLHPSTEGTRGRPAGDTGPLLRSAVVLLHTAWENYVERVAIEGLEFLLGQIGSDHPKLHHALEQKLAALKNPWALAGMG